ncbi:MAG: hypothetical protein HWQ38_08975 [Nostoc sp. NMS7]|uniref:hypothetical protein n=1 Tax=Nostoc sp. NMS7 TaxID=2815391 RepID=UPI0025E407EE|nr:hypothetical protein [Nostoc sp. NMS7]MBN3946610.1 hypothetical protein [Nostoc sp. NMS7]
MWFWSADSVEQELFDLYAPALRSLGVNFSDEQLQDTLEASNYGLEDAFRSAIVYMLWLEENLKPIYPTAIVIAEKAGVSHTSDTVASSLVIPLPHLGACTQFRQTAQSQSQSFAALPIQSERTPTVDACAITVDLACCASGFLPSLQAATNTASVDLIPFQVRNASLR